jgi:hypothetical protein
VKGDRERAREVLTPILRAIRAASALASDCARSSRSFSRCSMPFAGIVVSGDSVRYSRRQRVDSWQATFLMYPCAQFGRPSFRTDHGATRRSPIG